MNLPLPNWCSQTCYKKLEAIGTIYFKTYSNDELAKYVIGPTMEVFLKNIHNEESRKKIYLYSAHDINISTITRGLHITGIPELPDYGSSIIVEKLRDSSNNVYIKVCIHFGKFSQITF